MSVYGVVFCFPKADTISKPFLVNLPFNQLERYSEAVAESCLLDYGDVAKQTDALIVIFDVSCNIWAYPVNMPLAIPIEYEAIIDRAVSESRLIVRTKRMKIETVAF